MGPLTQSSQSQIFQKNGTFVSKLPHDAKILMRQDFLSFSVQ